MVLVGIKKEAVTDWLQAIIWSMILHVLNNCTYRTLNKSSIDSYTEYTLNEKFKKRE